MKNSRLFASRIAPLHPNRRTPPPAPPPVPLAKKKKTKKEIEDEEIWEDELIDELGMDIWLGMADDEKERARRDKFRWKRGEMCWED